MTYIHVIQKQTRFFFLLCMVAGSTHLYAQRGGPLMEYTVSMPDPSGHYFHIELHCSGVNDANVEMKMPAWMPGYYQLMHYARSVEHYAAFTAKGEGLPMSAVNENTWSISNSGRKDFKMSYDVKADKQFVANSLIDSAHGYLIPVAAFMYVNGRLDIPVTVKVDLYKDWKNIATGLEPVVGKPHTFKAPNFDILYDCPILMGNLEELPSFKVNGIEHRFIGYKMGNFDKEQFMNNLKKVVESAVAVIGDIPYKQYTFIGIGPGRGGIEHLNNTTVSFSGDGLDKPGAMNRTMNFLAHEYFHHYNVKRIRPYELGPFDYDQGSKTNLLWVSEGLSVYYEFMIVKRAGIVDEQTLFRNFEGNINSFENDPGRSYQSLTQASYETWNDGPFGRQGQEGDRSISYYEKGPVVGLILDLAIRNATQNKKSLDDVMRFLYWRYYKKMRRGFTDAEFQQACETTAGSSLSQVFEYVYTTKELDYNTYLGYAGLKITSETNAETGKKKYTIQRMPEFSQQQQDILQSLLGSK